MKKIMRVMVVVFCVTLTTLIPALACDVDAAGTIGAAGTAAVMGVENVYEASVIARMNGRAGASTANGAKGISFEIIYSDIKNTFHNIKNGLKTKLSTSSIDDLADLVTTNKSGEVVQLIQCKDGTSPAQIDKAIKQVSSGKYSSTELVGTKEFSALYNKKATAQGINQTATDSGISTQTTTRIANKALGIAPSGSQLLKSTLKNSGAAAAIAGCISLAESIYHGDDIYATTGNLVEDTSISAISVALATVASAELPALLTAVGASAVVANTAAAIVAFVVPVAGGYALYILADKCQFGEKIADALTDVTDAIAAAYHRVETAVVSYDIPSKAALAWESVSETGAEVKDSVWRFTKNAYEGASDTVSGWVVAVTSWFRK